MYILSTLFTPLHAMYVHVCRNSSLAVKDVELHVDMSNRATAYCVTFLAYYIYMYSEKISLIFS